MSKQRSGTIQLMNSTPLLSVEKKETVTPCLTLSSKSNEVFSSTMVIRTKPLEMTGSVISPSSNANQKLSKSTNFPRTNTEIKNFYSICFSSNPRGGIICFKNEELNEQDSQRIMNEVELKIRKIQRTWRKYFYSLMMAHQFKRTIDINYRSNSFDDKENDDASKLRVGKRLIPGKTKILPQCFTKEHRTNFDEYNQLNIQAQFKFRSKKKLQDIEKINNKNKIIDYWLDGEIEPINENSFSIESQKKKFYMQQIQNFALNLKSFSSTASNTVSWDNFNKIEYEDSFTLLKKKYNYQLSNQSLFIEKLDKSKFFRILNPEIFDIYANKAEIWNRNNEIELKEKFDIPNNRHHIFWALKSYNAVDYVFNLGRDEKEILYQLSKKDIMNLWNKINRIQHIHTGQKGMNYIIETFNNHYSSEYANQLMRKNFKYIDNNKINFCIERAYEPNNSLTLQCGQENSIFLKGNSTINRTSQGNQDNQVDLVNQITEIGYNTQQFYSENNEENDKTQENPNRLRARKHNTDNENSEVNKTGSAFSRTWNNYIIPSQVNNLKIIGQRNLMDSGNGFTPKTMSIVNASQDQNLKMSQKSFENNRMNRLNNNDDYSSGDNNYNKNQRYQGYYETYEKRKIENSKVANESYNDSFNSLLKNNPNLIESNDQYYNPYQEEKVQEKEDLEPAEYDVNVIKNDLTIKQLNGSSAKKDNTYIKRVKNTSPDKSKKITVYKTPSGPKISAGNPTPKNKRIVNVKNKK